MFSIPVASYASFSHQARTLKTNLLDIISNFSKYYFKTGTICIIFLSSHVFTTLEFDSNHFESVYPKCHFVFLINLKTKFKNLPLNFVFTTTFFIFIKNGKRNTVRFSLLIFMKELENELLKQIKVNFMIVFTSMIHTLFKSMFVSSPLRFSAV